MTLNGTVQGLWTAQRARARTKRGIATTVCAALFVIAASGASSSPAGTFVSLVFLFPALWWAWWGFIRLFAAVWERLVAGKPPDVRVGRAWQPGVGTRKQLREDTNATFFTDRGGILLRRRRWFVASGTPPIEIDPKRYALAVEAQPYEPCPVTSFRDRTYWWYQDAFYWTNADYGSADVKALLFARERRQERELDHARALLAAAPGPVERRREPIPRDVKLAVWTRDEGRCIECDSDFEIQYDHIIPFSMGGANTVENLQLLCARCNQAKGGRI